MSDFDVLKWLETAKPIKLVKGKGSPETGSCWMSALSVYSGEKWTDRPDCVCPVIRVLCVMINDTLPSDEAREQLIGPRLFDPIGTVSDESIVCFMRGNILLNNIEAILDEHGDDNNVLTPTLEEARQTLLFTMEATADWPIKLFCNYMYMVMDFMRRSYFDNNINFVVKELFPMLDKLIAIGNKTPIEMKCSVPEFEKLLQLQG